MKEHVPAICINCPVSRVARVAGDFWLILIIRALLERPKRFSELQQELAGISSRTLTQKLNRAVVEDIIARGNGEEGERARHHTYILTAKGKQLQKVVRAIEACAPIYEAECAKVCYPA